MKRFDPGDLHRRSFGRPSGKARAGRRRLRQGARLRQGPLALIAGLTLAACLAPGRLPEPPQAGGPTVTVYVVRDGWHSGLAIARDTIPPGVWPEQARFPAARFVEVGWGDRAFYRTPDAGLGLAVGAAVASEGSVLHVTGLDRPPAEHFAHAEVTPVVLSARGAEALARFVSGAYARDRSGEPIDMGPGQHLGSRFFAATGRYSLLYTCNRWIAEALRAGGCPITPAWALTGAALAFQARRCRPAGLSPPPSQ
jgi:uncharacterized protein (TIGR02117 family)